jgi:hypothetical protein
VEVARAFFELPEDDDRLRVIVGDGRAHLDRIRRPTDSSSSTRSTTTTSPARSPPMSSWRAVRAGSRLTASCLQRHRRAFRPDEPIASRALLTARWRTSGGGCGSSP